MNPSRPLKERLCIVKIGGNIIDDPRLLHSFLEDFAQVEDKKILVHGGGKVATAIGESLGIAPNYIDGRRITDESTLDLVTMVYGGLVNKKMVAGLQALHCNAMGVTGADANLLPAKKRPVRQVDYGWVGDLEAGTLSTGAWKWFLDKDLTPVVAPLTHDGAGHILNTNADTIASVIAVTLSDRYDVKLIFCFEKNGVLRDIADEHSVLPELDAATYDSLKKSGKLFAGILPKMDNAFDAARGGVKEVRIGNAAELPALAGGSGGTQIVSHE